jgi:hypothetical protein
LGCGEWRHYTLSTTTADFSLIEVVDEVSDRKVGRRMDKYLSQPKETRRFFVNFKLDCLASGRMELSFFLVGFCFCPCTYQLLLSRGPGNTQSWIERAVKVWGGCSFGCKQWGVFANRTIGDVEQW